jgi:hypothetical protein
MQHLAYTAGTMSGTIASMGLKDIGGHGGGGLQL